MKFDLMKALTANSQDQSESEYEKNTRNNPMIKESMSIIQCQRISNEKNLLFK